MKGMKLIHIADIHLDSSFSSQLPKEEARLRRQELLQSFSRALEYGEKEKVSAMLISGDLFDTPAPSSETLEAVLDLFRRHPSLSFFYLRGNHDTENVFKATTGSLPENLYFFGKSWTGYRLTKKIVIYGREFSYERGASAYERREQRGALDDRRGADLSERRARHSEFSGGGEANVSQQRNSGDFSEGLTLREEDFNIVLLHGQVTNRSLRNNGSSKNTGFNNTNPDNYSLGPAGAGSHSHSHNNSIEEDLISLPDFRYHYIDYMALGHIHKISGGELDARGRWQYAGCMEGRGFDECGRHGFFMLDIDEEKHSLKMEQIDLSERHFWELPVDVGGLASNAELLLKIEEILKSGKLSMEGIGKEKRIPEAGDGVKIRLFGSRNLAFTVNLPFIRQELKKSYSYADISDESRISVDYESFRRDLSLKGEFVRAVQGSGALSEEQKGEIIEMGIRLLMGEEA